ncbi:MAG TPA: tripartite tricarboxylate transporter substrate binding protein [Symbiobacteriaceae bacterium]|nr:tripartite tricarboxylate transporter substrate binding protein [Symbiobacteriaceae bacterium]
MRIGKVALAALLSLSVVAAVGCGGSKDAGTTPAGNAPAASTTAPASKYPEKAIEFVAASGAGGGLDTAARIAVKVLADEKIVTQAIGVTNKSGGGQSVGMTYLWEKKGDAYVLNVHSAPILLNPLTGVSKLTYKDITPIAQVMSDYDVVVVSADSKYKTIKDLIDALKANPKSVKLGGGSAPGSMDHLAFLKPAKVAGVDVKNIPYVSFQGGGEALTALLGKNVDVISTGIGEVTEQARAGKVRILAVTAPKRVEAIKDVPTWKESGVDADYTVWRGFFGPPNMPAEAVKYWETALEKLVKSSGWKAEADKLGWVLEYRNSADFTKLLEVETKANEALLNEIGLLKK